MNWPCGTVGVHIYVHTVITRFAYICSDARTGDKHFIVLLCLQMYVLVLYTKP
jgi:hypothetical protein